MTLNPIRTGDAIVDITVNDAIVNTIVNKLRMSQHHDLADLICKKIKNAKTWVKGTWLPLPITGDQVNLICNVLLNWGHHDVRGDVLCHILDQCAPLTNDRSGHNRVPTGV